MSRARVMTPAARARARRKALRAEMARIGEIAKQRLREAIEEGLIEGYIEEDGTPNPTPWPPSRRCPWRRSRPNCGPTSRLSSTCIQGVCGMRPPAKEKPVSRVPQPDAQRDCDGEDEESRHLAEERLHSQKC
jgi:hypothetical protein